MSDNKTKVPWPADGDRNGVVFLSVATDEDPNPDSKFGFIVWSNGRSGAQGRPFDFAIVHKDALDKFVPALHKLRDTTEASALMGQAVNDVVNNAVIASLLGKIVAEGEAEAERDGATIQ